MIWALIVYEAQGFVPSSIDWQDLGRLFEFMQDNPRWGDGRLAALRNCYTAPWSDFSKLFEDDR